MGARNGFGWVCFGAGWRIVCFCNALLSIGLGSFLLFGNWVCFAFFHIAG
jgi:hypothetical protein